MAIQIKEYIDANFYSNVRNKENGVDLSEADHNTAEAIDPDSLMVEIEGIHALPFVTRNYTRYTAKCLKESVPSWTQPYRRPLIKHHNEKDGEIIGRIINADYRQRNTLSGTPALIFTANIPGKQTKEDVKNGILSTTSIGVIAHDVRCSICGKQLAAGDMCEHERGVTYDTDDGPQTCYWDIHSMEAKELSYVIVPSDMYSKNVSIYKSSSRQNSDTQIKESLDEGKNIIVKGDIKDMPNENAEKLSVAEARIAELEAKVSELDTAKASLEAQVAEMTEEKSKLEAQVAELSSIKESLEAKAAEDAEMRSGLETAVSEAKAELKESLADTLLTMRESLGLKAFEKEAVMSRSADSLRDSIADMKEELSIAREKSIKESEQFPKAKTVADPTLPAPDAKEIKESAQSKNIDLKAGLQSIFNSALAVHR